MILSSPRNLGVTRKTTPFTTSLLLFFMRLLFYCAKADVATRTGGGIPKFKPTEGMLALIAAGGFVALIFYFTTNS